MRRALWALPIIIVLVILPIGCAIHSDKSVGISKINDNATADVGETYEIDIEPTQFHVTHINFTADIGIYGDFTVTQGENVTFLICDDENFERFKNNEITSPNVLFEKVPSANILFKPPETATWHIIFSNRYSDQIKHVQLQLFLDQTPPVISCNITSDETYNGFETVRIAIEEARFFLYVQTMVDGVELDSHLTESRIYIIDLELETLEAGQHTLYVYASDTVGNWDERSISFQIIASDPSFPLFPIFLLIVIIGAIIILIIFALLRGGRKSEYSPSSKYYLDASDLTNRDEWILILDIVDELLRNREVGDYPWEGELIKSITLKKDAGAITLTDREIREVAKVLGKVGLLILHENDTFSKPKDFEMRKSHFLDKIDS